MSILGDCNFELKQNKKILRSLCRDMPAAVREKFPELLVLGPEQLKVIQESKHYNKIVLHGGAGCGKTFILLYMLYKNTSKHLNESDCTNVVFVIPEKKTELIAYVEKFVDNFCNRNYVYIHHSSEHPRDFTLPQACKLILYDELYGEVFHHHIYGQFSHSCRMVVALGFFEGIPKVRYSHDFPPGWILFHLLASYRNPSNISSLCKKFLKMGASDPVDLISIALDSSLKVNDEDSIQIKHTDCCSEIAKQIAERKEETLLVADDENAFKSEFSNDFTIRVEVNFGNEDSIRKLAFTGVQYKTVAILLTKFTEINIYSLKILYHSVSRSTYRVILLTPDPEYYKNLLAETPVDLKVFEKLRRYKNVPKEDLLLLTNEEECLEALTLTTISGNCSMLESLIETFEARPDASGIRKQTIRILLQAFPRFQNGEILNIISKNFGDTINIEQMLTGYIDSAFTIPVLPFIQDRRRLREQFMELMPQRNLYAGFFYLAKSPKYMEDSYLKR